VIPCFAASSAASKIAVIWGTPIPAITRVVQMEPGPIPTLTQSAPASMIAFVPSAVAILPAIREISGNAALTFEIELRMFLL
jgi:hypothetical protein